MQWTFSSWVPQENLNETSAVQQEELSLSGRFGSPVLLVRSSPSWNSKKHVTKSGMPSMVMRWSETIQCSGRIRKELLVINGPLAWCFWMQSWCAGAGAWPLPRPTCSSHSILNCTGGTRRMGTEEMTSRFARTICQITAKSSKIAQVLQLGSKFEVVQGHRKGCKFQAPDGTLCANV